MTKARKVNAQECLDLNWQNILDYVGAGGLLSDALQYYGVENVDFQRFLRQDDRRRGELEQAEADQARWIFDGMTRKAVQLMNHEGEISMAEVRANEAGMKMVREALGMKNRKLAANYSPPSEGDVKAKDMLKALSERLERRSQIPVDAARPQVAGRQEAAAWNRQEPDDDVIDE